MWNMGDMQVEQEILPTELRGRFDFHSKPWKHQLDALQDSIKEKNYALFFEVGTGKTLTSILIARSKMAMEGRKLKVLVMCPLIVIDNWVKEWKKFSRLKAEGLVGSGAKVRNAITNSKADVLIINYDKIIQQGVQQFLIDRSSDIIIFDEIHKLKQHDSKRSKAAFAIAKTARYRIGLTGTPILNSPMDLFSQFRCLDLGQSFGDNFYSFRIKYFRDKNAGMPHGKHFPEWVPRIGAAQAITKQVAGFSAHVKKLDCLDLPPLVRETISVELSTQQRHVYDEVKKDFVSYMDDGTAVVARIALTKLQKLLQITTGFVCVESTTTNKKSVKVFPKNPKAEALRELLEMTIPSGKVIVWCAFKQNYVEVAAVCKKLKLPYVEVHGAISEKVKFKAVEAFNNDADTKVFIGHPGSGGIGINLVVAPTSIFYSRSFSLEHDLQAEARNHRGGSEIHERVTRFDLVAKDTVDEFVLKKLAAKEAIGASMLKEITREL